MFKKIKVVMLPTNREASVGDLFICSGVLMKPIAYRESAENLRTDPKYWMPQNLYFLSDEEIKEGDWKYQKALGKVMRHDGGYYNFQVENKIIATTDMALKLEAGDEGWKSIDGGWNEYKPIYKQLPQPSQSFIEKYVEEYNKGNIITEVMVEYDTYPLGPNGNVIGTDKPYPYNGLISNFEIKYGLKINPKDNTITIKKVKDSWNKEEILKALNNPYGQGSVSRDEYRARVMSELGLD